MNFLPTLLILMKILPRLPASVVTRCKTVCKSWLEYLSTPEIAICHCHFVRISGDTRILTTNRSNCLIRHVDITRNNVCVPFEPHACSVLFLASLDGMVCVCIEKTKELVVWNPLTRVFKKLSTPTFDGYYNVDDDSLGFSLDSCGDYKIMHIIQNHRMVIVKIYSLRQGSWSASTLFNGGPYNAGIYDWSIGTFCSNSLYFIVSHFWNVGGARVLCLDVDSNEFFDMGFPNVNVIGGSGYLVKIRDVIHMFVSIGFFQVNAELWKLENDSWTKVFSFVDGVCLPVGLMPSVHYVNGNDKCLVIRDWGDVTEIDLKTNKGFTPIIFTQSVNGAICMETLLSPDAM